MRQKMATTVGIYEGFTLDLRIPLLVQDNVNHNEKMAESSITEINHAESEDSHPQAIESIAGVATNTGGFLSLVKCNHNAECRCRHREHHQTVAIPDNFAEPGSAQSCITDTKSHVLDRERSSLGSERESQQTHATNSECES